MTSDRTDVSASMPAEMVGTIESQLRYGDSRAEWIREACRQRLEREGILDENEAENPAD